MVRASKVTATLSPAQSAETRNSNESLPVMSNAPTSACEHTFAASHASAWDSARTLDNLKAAVSLYMAFYNFFAFIKPSRNSRDASGNHRSHLDHSRTLGGRMRLWLPHLAASATSNTQLAHYRLPLVLEAIVAVEFLIFLALPTRAETTKETQRRGNAAIVGSR